MTLLKFLQLKNKTQIEFASKIGVTLQSVYNYCHGHRTPKPEIMRKIFSATNGMVTANDFHDIKLNIKN